MLYINGISVDKLYKQIDFFCISESFFESIAIFLNNSGVRFMHAWRGRHLCWTARVFNASPSSGEAYRDRRLTTNFELWVEIFSVPTCFHMRIPKPCLSVCLSICQYPEKRNHHTFVNISPTLVIDTSMERSSRVSVWKKTYFFQTMFFILEKKIQIFFHFFFQKFLFNEFILLLKVVWV